MRGKYSPTVNAAYRKDQNWHYKHCEDGTFYDRDGYDSYGYNKDDYDRAGNHEHSYIKNDAHESEDSDYNMNYDEACSQWGFDGTKPVCNA